MWPSMYFAEEQVGQAQVQADSAHSGVSQSDELKVLDLNEGPDMQNTTYDAWSNILGSFLSLAALLRAPTTLT